MLKIKNPQKKAKTENCDVEVDLNAKAVKYPKPAICCFDFKKSDSALIEEAGYKIYEGSLGPLVSMKNEYKQGHYCLPIHDIPQNLHEYDILIFDLNNQSKIEFRTEDHNKKEVSTSDNYYLYCGHPKTIFNPAPFVGKAYINPIISELEKRDSIIIIFSDKRKESEYQYVKQDELYPKFEEKFSHNNYSFMPNGVRYDKDKNGKCIKYNPKIQLFDSLFKKYIDQMEYYATFYHPTNWVNGTTEQIKTFTPLLYNNDNEIISYVEKANNQWIFVFPEFESKGQFVKELLESILPEIIPQLFPAQKKGAWIKENEYLLPNELDLQMEKESLLQKHRNELDEINIRLEQNKIMYSFLHKMLLETDHELVISIITFLKWLGFSHIEDVDDENEDKKEEDIRIEIDEGLLVIEVKGIGGTSKDDECAQISKIRSRRCEERGDFNVSGLYIVNHQRYIPPLQRKNPPFSEDQVKDAKRDKRGLLTTWDLFNLFFNIQVGVISKEQARKDLLKIGLVEFQLDRVKELGRVNKVYQQGEIVIIDDIHHPINKGENIFVKSDNHFMNLKALSLQVDDEDTDTVTQGDVGIKLDHRLKKGDMLYISI